MCEIRFGVGSLGRGGKIHELDTSIFLDGNG
jgi:hypothetical protein